MSEDSDYGVDNIPSTGKKSKVPAVLNQRCITVSGRKCLLFSTVMNRVDFISVMQNAEHYPELINDAPPTTPGFNGCEVFITDKRIQKSDLCTDDFTPWYRGGIKKSLERQHSYFYTLNAHGHFDPSPKIFATHVLRITVYVLASCHGLNKKVVRMVRIDGALQENCLPSLIVYTFQSGFERPVPNSPAILNREELDDIQRSANLQSGPSASAVKSDRDDSCEPKSKTRRMSYGSSEVSRNLTKNPKEEPLEEQSLARQPLEQNLKTPKGEPVEEEEEESREKEEHGGQSENTANHDISDNSSINKRLSLFSVQQTQVNSLSDQNRKFQNYEMFSAGVLSNATVPAPMFHPHITPIADLDKDTSIDPDEVVQRNKLAALYRLVDLFRWSQGIYNHITVRVSNDPDEILINAFGQLYNEVSASSLIKVDMDGTVINGGSTGFGVNQAGYVLHSAVHRARPEIKCVVHLHHPSVVAVSAQKCGLLPISQEAMIVGEVGYHEYRGILIDEAERALLVRDLGDRHVMILRNHGFVVCGESVEHALSVTYHLIIACETQVKTVPGGNTDNVHFPAHSAIKQVYQVASNGGGGVNRQNGHVNSTQWRKGELEWQAYMRQLDAQGYVTGHDYNCKPCN
ncbi:Protein CBR-ADD-2 [Caenorhabditis briggsae]|uniref:Class II aldolase/adducin N-terminal domain-containing protein n=3 Tax=Caenorhabditis briggsae TaxID=6238 RepID=A0AAE8ZZT3_CAEBR|nr:Protein CBR-ADD-2 [Caenorhabditis briggsae]ULT88925.1 hypothetical protein L3Y34_007845 [Caenorhabditis briggsae]CAP39664.1 Protein CBR-ADD-2 [Caenorhabditis briggsae]